MKPISMAKLSSIGLAVVLPILSFSSSATDARSMAMGGTGVASASYLTAPFFNPAQLTSYNGSDDFGLLLPAVAVTAHDKDELFDKIDHFQDLDDQLKQNPSDKALEAQWKDALKALDNASVKAEVQLGLAVSIPNQYLSVSLFSQANVALMATTLVDGDDLNSPDPDNMKSKAHAMAGGTVDVGLALAREFALPFEGQTLAVGVSPKLQHIVALNYKNTVSGFEEDDFNAEDEYTEKSGINIDAGVTYKPWETVSVGFAARNLISEELLTNASGPAAEGATPVTYLVEPQYAMGMAYDNGWFSIALDADLNAKRYFKESKYETQYARVGIELDAWEWAQLRAGYSLSMTDYAQDTFSAGIGLKPFGAFGIDLGAQYGEDNNFGVAAQLVFTL